MRPTWQRRALLLGIATAAFSTVLAACGEDTGETEDLRVQVAVLQTQVAAAALTAAVPTPVPPTPTLTVAAATPAPQQSLEASPTRAAGQAPRLTSAAVTGALKERPKEARVCRSIFGGDVLGCNVELYLRGFCNFDSATTKLPISLEFALSADAHQPVWFAVWDGEQARWDVIAGCRSGPNGSSSSTYHIWFFEDRWDFVGANASAAALLN